MLDNIPALLNDRTRRRPGDPMITYVDATTGERTELSAISLSNAASKIANTIVDSFELIPPSRIALAMSPHWQLATWCAGAWLGGFCVAVDPGIEPDVIVTDDPSPDVPEWPAITVQVVSRHPFGLPIAHPLPAHAEDVTITVRQQPDAFLFSAGVAQDLAVESERGAWDQSQLVQEARSLGARWGVDPGTRFMIDDDLTPLDAVLACAGIPLALDASVVIAHGAEESAHRRIAEQERATRVVER